MYHGRSSGAGVGMTAEEGLAAVISLARTADRRGYHRFWTSEHHAMGATSVSSPQLMVARLIAETAAIRLGAGGHAAQPFPAADCRAVRDAGGPRPGLVSWPAAGMPEINRLYRTVCRWWAEIEVLIVTGAATAKVEANNTAIKHIRRTARDYRNADNYKARILLRSAARMA